MKILVLGHNRCSFCKQAINYLANKGESFEYKDAYQEENKHLLESLRSEGITTVPQIWIDEKRIGGFKELQEYI